MIAMTTKSSISVKARFIAVGYAEIPFGVTRLGLIPKADRNGLE